MNKETQKILKLVPAERGLAVFDYVQVINGVMYARNRVLTLSMPTDWENGWYSKTFAEKGVQLLDARKVPELFDVPSFDPWLDATHDFALTPDILDAVKVAKNFVDVKHVNEKMNAVYISPTDVVSTDAHTLYRSRIETDTQGVLLPPQVVKLLEALPNVTHLYHDKKTACIEYGGGCLWFDYDGKYVNYDAVWPKEEYYTATLLKADLLDALKDNEAYLPSSFKTTLLFYEGGLQLTAENLDEGVQQTVEIPCTYKGWQGETLKIAFDSKKLAKILKFCAVDILHTAFTEPNRAVIINDEFLLMPMML
jgi:DNA polymerase III sliding clamp (beta) subunit (PCNA family)